MPMDIFTSSTSSSDLDAPSTIAIGMVHVGALPGTPYAQSSIRELVEHAVNEATMLTEAGFDAIILENMHDRPYLRREVGPEIIAGMTRVGTAVRDAITTLPIGVQILAGANQAALAVAQAIDAQFIRAEGFVFASVADEGLMDEADASKLLRYRKMIGAESVRIYCDIKKKHSSHAITSDVDIAATARAAAFFGADGIIITGGETGEAIDLGDLKAVRAATDLPIVVGSGVTAENISTCIPLANGVIVGSALKQNGRWENILDSNRVQQFIEAFQNATQQ